MTNEVEQDDVQVYPADPRGCGRVYHPGTDDVFRCGEEPGLLCVVVEASA
jgi:hypothetical protein